MWNSSIWPIGRTFSGATPLGQTEPGSDGNEGVLCIPQRSSITEASQPDCLVPYPGYTCIYLPKPSARAVMWKTDNFKLSLTGLNLEFSFSLTGCHAKVKDVSLRFNLSIAGVSIVRFIPLLKGIGAVWNANSRIYLISPDDTHNVSMILFYIYFFCFCAIFRFISVFQGQTGNDQGLWTKWVNCS